jgi:hypothetical protein
MPSDNHLYQLLGEMLLVEDLRVNVSWSIKGKLARVLTPG